MSTTTDERTYTVPGMSCEHCRSAVTTELMKQGGVQDVAVDLTTKHVTVTGTALDDATLRGAIDAAGYDVA